MYVYNLEIIYDLEELYVRCMRNGWVSKVTFEAIMMPSKTEIAKDTMNLCDKFNYLSTLANNACSKSNNVLPYCKMPKLNHTPSDNNDTFRDDFMYRYEMFYPFYNEESGED